MKKRKKYFWKARNSLKWDETGFLTKWRGKINLDVDRCFYHLLSLFPRHWFNPEPSVWNLTANFSLQKIDFCWSNILWIMKFYFLCHLLQPNLQIPPQVPKPFQILKIFCRKNHACKRLQHFVIQNGSRFVFVFFFLDWKILNDKENSLNKKK